MDKRKLSTSVKTGMTQREIGDKYGLAQTSVRYWLVKYGLETQCAAQRAALRSIGSKACSLCGKKIDLRRTHCNSCITKIRRHRHRLGLVALLGGSCKECGWSGPAVGFDFHHIGDKEDGIANLLNRSWSMLRREARRCVLLCSTCHRMKHADYSDKVVEVAKKYRGRNEELSDLLSRVR